MLSKGKGKIAALIVAKLKEKRDSSPEDAEEYPKEESSGDAGLESAADDLITALNRKDAAGVARALCDFIELHEGHGSDSEEE